MNSQQQRWQLEYEITTQFLESNNVHTDWIDIIKENFGLRHHLLKSITHIDYIETYRTQRIPERNKTLLALSRCPPKDVKVVILGHDPIPDSSLATGYAFSFPVEALVDRNAGESNYKQGRGVSLLILHAALVDAGYLEAGTSYDCCHEEWADRGVLLLNASLTFGGGDFEIWKEFTKELLFEVFVKSRQERLFFLCWGTNAEVIGNWLSRLLTDFGCPVQTITDDKHDGIIAERVRSVIFIGDHPTYPRDTRFLCQAPNQFRAIKKYYPDLFTLPPIQESGREQGVQKETEQRRES